MFLGAWFKCPGSLHLWISLGDGADDVKRGDGMGSYLRLPRAKRRDGKSTGVLEMPPALLVLSGG